MNLYGVLTKGLLAAGFLFFAYVMYGDGDTGFAAVALALGALLAAFAWRDARRPRPAAGAPPAPPGLSTAAITLTVIVGIDIVFFGAPALGRYLIIALLVWLIPRIFTAWRKPELRRHRALVALCAAGAIAADIAAYAIYDAVAQKRVIEVADALVRYKAAHGAYPQKLDELVPRELQSVPVAKPGLVMSGGIHYLRKETGPGLMYTSFPPFGRKVLAVETRKWEMID